MMAKFYLNQNYFIFFFFNKLSHTKNDFICYFHGWILDEMKEYES